MRIPDFIAIYFTHIIASTSTLIFTYMKTYKLSREAQRMDITLPVAWMLQRDGTKFDIEFRKVYVLLIGLDVRNR